MPITASTVLVTDYDAFRVHYHQKEAGKETEDDRVSFAKGNVTEGQPVIRLQSGCLFAAAFQSIECDCRNQIDRALRIISENQSGVLVYSPGQEGRGAGLEAKMIAMGIEHALGCDSVEAYARLGLPIDSRTYDLEIDALRELSVSKTIGLLGKNPAKKAALEKAGFVVQEFTNFEHGPLTNTAKRKQRRMGFF